MLSTSPQHPRASHGAGGISGHTGQRCEPPGPVDESPEERSESTTDPVSRLPFELATACFRLLSFRGRFAVSHVSRAWRRIALADCCLWDTLQVEATRRHGLEALETLLARSGDVPFNFSWVCSAAIPDDVLGVLERNMGRMGKLKCWGAPDRLLWHSAPALRRLALPDLRAVLPADWTHSVPRLEVLKLDVFSIPADFQPLPALTSFSGCLAEGSSAPVLARVFPRLTTLQLEGVTQETVRALGAPPPSCRSVVLKPLWRSGVAVDYSPFERACHGLCIPHIALSGATSIAAAAEEFAHATRGDCRMIVRNDSSLTLESKADGVVRLVESAGALPFVAQLGGAVAHLDRLTELALPLALLLGIVERQSARAAFPALRTLQLVLAPADIARTARIPGRPLAMPRLAKVVLEVHRLDYARDERAYSRSYNAPCRAHLAWLLADWPGALPALVTFAGGRPRLAALTVVMSYEEDAKHFAAREDLGALRALAETFHVTHRSAFYEREDSDEDAAEDVGDDEADEY